MGQSVASPTGAVQLQLYLDEDLSNDPGTLLRADGIDAVHTREMSRAGAKVPRQIAYAVGENRALVTANLIDFRVLHGAWLLWAPLQHSDDPRPHPGILVVPNPNVMAAAAMAQPLGDFVRGGSSTMVQNRLIEWRSGHGWKDLSAVR